MAMAAARRGREVRRSDGWQNGNHESANVCWSRQRRVGHASPTVLYRYLVYIRIWSGRGWGSGGCGVMLRRRGGMSHLIRRFSKHLEKHQVSAPLFRAPALFSPSESQSSVAWPIRLIIPTARLRPSRSQPRPHAAPRRPRRLPEEGGLCRSYALSATVSSFVCGDRIVRTQTSLRLTRRARDVHDGGANGLGGGHQEAEHVRDPTIGVRTS